MKLTVSEREHLRAVLLDAFGTIEFFERLVQKLGKNPDDFAPTAGITDRMDALILHYEAQDDVQALFDIPPTVTGWEDNVGLKAALDLVRKSYIERRGSTWMCLPNPFKACFLAQGRPFINRDDFRDHLQELNKEEGKRFLVVNGSRGSGRTYSHYLIADLAPHCGYKPCFIQLEKETPSKYYPDIMARRIDRDLTLPKIERMPKEEDWGERWPRELCDWLVEKMLVDGSHCWIVLDGFGNPDLHRDLPDETKRLLQELIDAVDKRLRQVRLVLLDYRLTLPRELRQVVRIEDIQEIDQIEISAFFKAVFHHAQVDYDDEQVQGFTAKILKDLPAVREEADGEEDRKERMLEIMERVMEIRDQLLPKE